ncbi:hypothetical protein HMPREF0262_01380 [Clostridium sp. ATCC 29733]|nr:hypothetical protein HMPREF0262_01380 [Clostridium sp. ATCC 29733]
MGVQRRHILLSPRPAARCKIVLRERGKRAAQPGQPPAAPPLGDTAVSYLI